MSTPTTQTEFFSLARIETTVLRRFSFESGENLDQMRVAYHTLGNPDGPPVLILHGTLGSGRAMLAPAFAAPLFAPGGPLDAAHHRIILPDAIGCGASAKPSDGLGMCFPHYTYADMVRAQHRLVHDHLGLDRVKLVLGYSMGGMQTYLWGHMFPDFAEGLVALAATPAPMAARNWATRRMMMETIKRDPGWQNGAYERQPPNLALALAAFNLATNGGELALHAQAPDRLSADSLVERALSTPTPHDANDVLYQFDAARDYDPSGELTRITAPLLAINSEDDERNPVSLGLMKPALRRMARARLHLIPASAETCGHATTFHSRFWADELSAFLA